MEDYESQMCSVVCRGFPQTFCPFSKLSEDRVCCGGRHCHSFRACCVLLPTAGAPLCTGSLCKGRFKQVHLTFFVCPVKSPTGFHSVAIFVLNSMQSHLLPSFWGSLSSWHYPYLPSFFFSLSSPRVRRKQYVGTYSCLKFSVSSGFPLPPSWVAGSRAKILRIPIAS